jgi:hypothetical protein
MGKYQVDLASIEKKLPAGWAMPAGLRDLAQRCQRAQRGELGWFALKYVNPKSLAGGDVGAKLVPFLYLPDGGFVAFWFKTKSTPRVVWLGSEGETDIVARTWPEFARLFAQGRTGVEDLDDRRAPDDEAEFVPHRRPRSPERRELLAWLKSCQPKPERGLAGERGESIRNALFAVLKKHVKKSYDKVDLVVSYTSRTYRVSWYAGGLKPYPQPKALLAPLTTIKELLGHSFKQVELTMYGNGDTLWGKNTVIGKLKQRL